MRRRKVDSAMERQFLTALITSKPFLAQAAPALVQADLSASPLLERVAGWCIDYWQEYGEAPGHHIETIYHSWVEREEPDERETQPIHDLLSLLSEEQEVEEQTVNVPYLIDELGTFLSLRALKQLQEEVEQGILHGEVDSAIQSLHNFHPVDLGQGAGVDPINDDIWQRTFAEGEETLIEYKGDAGRFFNKALTRDALVAIQGPEKRGKTFWCIELALRALEQRRRVAFFSVGDLSERQLMKRLGVRIAQLPLWPDQCGKIHMPKKIRLYRNENNEIDPEIEFRVVKCPRIISQRGVIRAIRKFMKRRGLAFGKPYLMTSTHPTNSINVAGVEAILDRWKHERDFIPDVIVIDYADILAPESTRRESRDQYNETWSALRRLSQERRCLVITPTQAKAAAYDAETMTMKHFSEDKRKMAHVTAMLGLNQTPQEKALGVMRVNWIVLRESDFHALHCLWVGQCFPLGRAFCCGKLYSAKEIEHGPQED